MSGDKPLANCTNDIACMPHEVLPGVSDIQKLIKPLLANTNGVSVRLVGRVEAISNRCAGNIFAIFRNDERRQVFAGVVARIESARENSVVAVVLSQKLQDLLLIE